LEVVNLRSGTHFILSRYSFNNSSEGIEDCSALSIVGAGLFRDEAVTLVEAYSERRLPAE